MTGPASNFQQPSITTHAMTNFDHGENSSKDFAELAHNLNELRDLWIQIGLELHDFLFEKDQSSHELVFRQSQMLIDNAMQRDSRGS